MGGGLEEEKKKVLKSEELCAGERNIKILPILPEVANIGEGSRNHHFYSLNWTPQKNKQKTSLPFPCYFREENKNGLKC